MLCWSSTKQNFWTINFFHSNFGSSQKTKVNICLDTKGPT